VDYALKIIIVICLYLYVLHINTIHCSVIYILLINQFLAVFYNYSVDLLYEFFSIKLYVLVILFINNSFYIITNLENLQNKLLY